MVFGGRLALRGAFGATAACSGAGAGGVGDGGGEGAVSEDGLRVARSACS